MGQFKKIKKTAHYGYYLALLGALFYFYQYLLRVSPSSVRSDLMNRFDIGASLVSALSIFYFYAYTPMQLVAGILVDRLNLRTILASAVFLCALGTLLIGITDQYVIAALGRFLQGLGSAFAFVGTLKAISQNFPANRFSSILGLCTSMGFLGALAGLFLLPRLSSYFSLAFAMSLLAFFGCLLAVSFIYIRAPKASIRKNLSLPMDQYLLKFCHMLKRWDLWLIAIISAFMYTPTLALSSQWGAPYLQAFRHYNAHQASTAAYMIFAGWALGSSLCGFLSDYWNMRLWLITLGAFLAALLSFVLLYAPLISYPWALILSIFLGIFASSQILIFSIARDLASPFLMGLLFGLINAITMLGGSLFQLIVNTFLDDGWQGNYDPNVFSLVSPIHNYQLIMTAIPLAFLISAVLSLFTFMKTKIR